MVGTQVAAEHHQSKKLDQIENISTSLKICHRISLNFNTAENFVNTATKKDLTEKLSQEKTGVRVTFLIKLQADACLFIKKETPGQVFSCEVCEISMNTFFTEHLQWLRL